MRWRNRERRAAVGASDEESPRSDACKRVIIVGNPNVGKSALFNRLTGHHVTVSNYPGTTVEVSRGACHALGPDAEVIDTPGMYSLLPITAEERVARDILFDEPAHAIVHVIDAKNIRRMLGLTLQLVEAGLPVVLAVNLMDEARAMGIRVNTTLLSEFLGISVVGTVSVTGEGIGALRDAIRDVSAGGPRKMVGYGAVIEAALADIAADLGPGGAIAPRTTAALLLQGDSGARERLIGEAENRRSARILQVIADTAGRLTHSVHYNMTLALKARTDQIVDECVIFPERRERDWRTRLDWFLMHPLTGFPLVVAILYFGLYQLVGRFGAGTLVDFLETHVFRNAVNPWTVRTCEALVPWAPLRDLIAGEFGIVTLGIRYALAIVLPIVTLFFFFFAILEDTGYLPRLAMLIDRIFKRIGLNGRAVIPIVLGLACDTMATLVARTLETRRERLICTILLALAIPCSAQIGLIMALLAGHPGALLFWTVFIIVVFLITGRLTAAFLPGEGPSFYMELPPLRLPLLSNIVVKTGARLVWYCREVIPLFIAASVMLWLGNLLALFAMLTRLFAPVMELIGLPAQAAKAFIFGFFRRDYGAAGLYDLQRQGILSGNQLVVAAITLTLFLPCVAQLLVMKKEQGTRLAAGIATAVLVVAFSAGFVADRLLLLLGWQL